MFLDARRVRDRIYRLLDRRLWPREQTDLYFLLGCLNGLMAIPANQLGYPDAAEELNRAGFAYANAIDHRPLMAWLRGELSVYAYYRGRFEESRDLALSGLQYLSVGQQGSCACTSTTRGQRAAWAMPMPLARPSATRTRPATATTTTSCWISAAPISSRRPPIMAWPVPRSPRRRAPSTRRQENWNAPSACTTDGPGEREDHWFGGKPLAGIDLAVVRLRSGALDAAAAALQPALSLPVAQRISDVTIRLAAVRDELAAPIFRGSPQARDLGEQIEEFGREAIAAGLHSLSG